MRKKLLNYPGRPARCKHKPKSKSCHRVRNQKVLLCNNCTAYYAVQKQGGNYA